MFRKYSPDDFDKHHFLKAPVGFYFVLLMLLRPYIIWVMSVANRKDGTSFITMLYPDKNDFLVGLLTGIGALIVLLLFSMRRDKSFDWLPGVWKNSRWLLWVSLVADVALSLWIISNSNFTFKPEQAGGIFALLLCALYLFKNERLKDFFHNWPEEALKGYVKPEEETEEKAKD